MTFLLINRMIFHNWSMSQLARKIISDNIKKFREKSGLKREELSLKLGCDNSYISKLERYKVNIPIDRIEEIANILGINLIDLFK